MMRFLRSAALVLMLAGCISSPPALVVLPSPPAGTPVASPAASLLLRPVRVPGYLDGLGVVIRRDGGSVQLAENTEWAERLSDGTSRVLAEALAARLGADRLLIEGDGRIPDADLSVDILRLDPLADGRLLLEARWTMVGSRGDRPTRSGTATIPVQLRGGTATDVAVASSEALAGLADRLAAAAASFPRAG